MRFIERLGLKAIPIERVAALDQLGVTLQPTTLVIPAGRGGITPARARTLARWADAGGHLVVEAEPARSPDHLLDVLGIGRRNADTRKPSATLQVEFPGAGDMLNVSAGGRVVLEVARVPVELLATDPAGVRLASWRHGAGRVTVLGSMTAFRNRAIGSHDNAELLKRISALGPRGLEVHWLRAPHEQALWSWLVQYALVPIAVAALLLMLWLWHVLPRCGPIRPLFEADRRQLMEHIRANGRFRWASGARTALLSAARDRCLRHMLARAPRIAHAQVAERYRMLAQEIDAGVGAIEYAFEGTPANSRDFVHIVATLASIHQRLSRFGRGPVTRRRTP